jgi:ATP-binding cassette subfamily F protein uup
MVGAQILSIKDGYLQIGDRIIFSGLSVSLFQGERVALIGRNGSGKSTLLKLCANSSARIKPFTGTKPLNSSGLVDSGLDSGELILNSDVTSVYVPQEEPTIFDNNDTIKSALERVIERGEEEFTHHVLSQDSRTIKLIADSGFSDLYQPLKTLSGGWRKRLALVKGIINFPQLLLLDEPTNHLDIDGINWLENTLSTLKCTVFFVSHDRAHIERIATRVIELAPWYPGGALVSDGGYLKFLERREAFLEQQEKLSSSLANKARQELAWLRQGAKARSTKAKHRTKSAVEIIERSKQSQSLPKKIHDKIAIDFSSSNRGTSELLRLEKVHFSFGEKKLIKNLSVTISKGDCVGIIGANGSGKTTLLQLLLKELAPTEGVISAAHKLKIGYLDQKRKSLPVKLTVRQALCPEGDSIIFQGRQVHVNSWAERFLFSRSQLDLPIESLSGGEKVRILLADLMVKEFDLLVLDEPSNDLDIATLEVLEESITSFSGAVLLVSHDRFLLEQVATVIIGLSTSGSIVYADYFQWESEQLFKKVTNSDPANNTSVLKVHKPNNLRATEREAATIERKITKAESLLIQYELSLNDPEVAANAEELKSRYEKVLNQKKIIEDLYEVWGKLTS